MKKTKGGYGILLFLALSLATLSVGQEITGKYVMQSEEGPVTLYLEEVGAAVEGALVVDYGVRLPLEARFEGDILRGELSGSDPPTAIEGRPDAERLVLTLIQGSERHELALERQTGAEPIGPDAGTLLSILALVPDTLDAVSGLPGVGYVDFRAMEAADGMEGPRNAAEFEALTEDQRTRWLEALGRIRVAPQELLMYALQAIEGMPELLGFEWFDIEQAVTYGTLPRSPTILRAAVDHTRVAGSLARRGLQRAEWQGVAVWHRQDDAAQDLSSRDPADPFGGFLGAAQRIALLPGYLANSRYWRLTEAIIDAHGDRAPSLADSPSYRILAEAVDDRDSGVLIQAVFMDPLEVGLMPDDPARFLGLSAKEVQERLRAEAEEAAQGEPLPRYGLAVLADRQERDERVAMIALLYPDAETAGAAAVVLTRRLTRLTLDADYLGLVSVDQPRVYRSENGLTAAVAAIRYPMPSEGGENSFDQVGFPGWFDAFMRREFGVLRIGTGP